MKSTLSRSLGQSTFHSRARLLREPVTGNRPDLVVQFGQGDRVNEQRLLKRVRDFGPSIKSNFGFALFDNAWRSGFSPPNRIKHCAVAAQPQRIVQQLTEQLRSGRAFESFNFTTRLFKKPNDDWRLNFFRNFQPALPFEPC